MNEDNGGAGPAGSAGFYFKFACWRAAGRSEAAIDAFMARRKVYFDALNAYAKSIGIDNPAYVTAPDEAVGFEIGPRDRTPVGYSRDATNARHRVALRLHTPANPNRIYPNKGTPAERTLRELWRKYGGALISATQLSLDLTGHTGPFTATASDGRSTTTMHFSLRREGEDADAHWVIMAPEGAPAPYDAVPLPAHIRTFEPKPRPAVWSSVAAVVGRGGIS